MNTSAQTQYHPGDTIAARDYDGEQFVFTLSDCLWFGERNHAGVLINYVTTEYFSGHGTEFTVHLRQDSVEQWRTSGLDVENPYVTIDSAELGDDG